MSRFSRLASCYSGIFQAAGGGLSSRFKLAIRSKASQAHLVFYIRHGLSAADLAALGSAGAVGTMPKTPGEIMKALVHQLSASGVYPYSGLIVGCTFLRRENL